MQPKRILLAVTGLSPQIVTETLYALCVAQDPAWVPDEIHLITSQEGAERARLSLLDPVAGQFHAFCRDYPQTLGVAFTPAHIHTIADRDGNPLPDIRTPEDNAQAADAIHALVREFTADPASELHVSIAGGRKTMGFYLGYCLSLAARPQDKLSTDLLKNNGIKISMDGKGCWRDNVFIERLWKSVKYEEVYLKAYDTVAAARDGLGTYLTFYNNRRPHQSLDGKTPDTFYFDILPPMKIAA